MTDLLKGLTGGGWAGLFAWIFPTAISLTLFTVLVYAQLFDAPLRGPFDELSLAEQTAAVMGIAAAIGFVLNALSTPLYRVLEGYAWPQKLLAFAARRQRELKAELEAEERAAASKGWERGLLLEKLSRFPLDDDQVAPTRLGNALRAFETYGKTRYNLDSQTLWTELCSVVPKSLQDELERSRATVDFFVALIYLSFILGSLAIVGAVAYPGHPGAYVYGAISLISTPVWYSMAVTSSSYWSSTVQALVNLGRTKLAEELGLEIPTTLSEEHAMWGLVTGFVYYGDTYTGEQLDAFRKGAAAARNE